MFKVFCLFQVMSSLQHPYITRFFQSLQCLEELVIVMEYCAGGDLRAIINQRNGVFFREERILDWFTQLCLAVKYMHDKNILHRDIKSQNIFLTQTGKIKLGDFGISKTLDCSKDLANTCIGTPYYMSPEICTNKPYNSKSDIWALGCVLYEMAALKHPFQAICMKSLLMKIIKGSFSPIPAKFSWDFKSLIRQILQKDPKARPSIASILAKTLLIDKVSKYLDEVGDSDLIVALREKSDMHQKMKRSSPAFDISGPASKYGHGLRTRKNHKSPPQYRIKKQSPLKEPTYKSRKPFSRKYKGLSSIKLSAKDVASNQQQEVLDDQRSTDCLPKSINLCNAGTNKQNRMNKILNDIRRGKYVSQEIKNSANMDNIYPSTPKNINLEGNYKSLMPDKGFDKEKCSEIFYDKCEESLSKNCVLQREKSTYSVKNMLKYSFRVTNKREKSFKKNQKSPHVNLNSNSILQRTLSLCELTSESEQSNRNNKAFTTVKNNILNRSIDSLNCENFHDIPNTTRCSIVQCGQNVNLWSKGPVTSIS